MRKRERLSLADLLCSTSDVALPKDMTQLRACEFCKAVLCFSVKVISHEVCGRDCEIVAAPHRCQWWQQQPRSTNTMRVSETSTRRIRLAASALIVLAAPLGFSSTEGLVVNDASACMVTGTCCKETSSICNAGGPEHMDYYYKAEGKCSPLMDE